jgi:LPXTG-site transpeptidase (sortase) family protein
MDNKNKQNKSIKNNKFLVAILRVIKLLIIFAFVFLVVYLTLNFQALYTKVKYWYLTDIKKTEYRDTNQYLVQSELPSPYLSGSSVSTDIPKTNNGSTNTENVAIANNQLVIPKIDVRAPILWNISADNAIPKLQEGVVHIKPTSLPGEDKGNVFITGHSSYYPWDPGKFKHVFALLPQLQEGDKFYIEYQDVLYKYEIFETVVVNPDQTWVMKPDNKTMVSLMTCVPIGTSLRRFVARARQVKPSPKAVAKKSKDEDTKTEPKDIPSDLLPRIFD